MERFPQNQPNKRQKRVDEPPPGWRGCPQVGSPIPLDPRNPQNSVYIVPFKAPLGDQWQDITRQNHFSPESFLSAQARLGRKISYVIDLTNSRRYYQPHEFTRNRVEYIKLACRGHGEVPDPLSVNTFVFKVLSLRRQDEPVYIGVHCTHGFNRTGFMVVNALMRLSQPTTLDLALETYRKSRDPGIYKKRYVESLKRYYHEPRTLYAAAPTPQWKIEDAGGDDDSGEDDEEEYNEHSVVYGASGENLTHEMPFGEQISEEETYVIQTDVVYFIKGQKQRVPRFPGAQPVSLARSNLNLLKDHEYFVTWKADGTRYMVLIVPQGMYFMDRSFRVQRLQMRFPRWTAEEVHGKTAFNLRGQFHDFTLLDGELVVDKEPSGRLTRRYLVYDIMFENGRNVMEKPFAERFDYITHYMLNPRRFEAELMNKPHARYFYDYNAEAVRIRRKHFWDVEQTANVLHEFSDDLCHETDGLIFQAKGDKYQPGTCEKILKWKCSSKNSVDFVYRQRQPGDPSDYQILLVDRQMGDPRDKHLYALEGVSLVFPQGEDPNKYDGLILECVWDPEIDSWVYQRIRGDKDSPNAYRVYEKILQSIDDNITEEILVQWLNENQIKQDFKHS